MRAPTAWHQVFSLTERMVFAAQDDAWEQLSALQQDRDALMATLSAPTNATLLQEIISLNRTVENLSSKQRDALAQQLHRGHKNRQGIHAYQSVTKHAH